MHRFGEMCYSLEMHSRFAAGTEVGVGGWHSCASSAVAEVMYIKFCFINIGMFIIRPVILY
jgi:hypothetical protein